MSDALTPGPDTDGIDERTAELLAETESMHPASEGDEADQA